MREIPGMAIIHHGAPFNSSVANIRTPIGTYSIKFPYALIALSKLSFPPVPKPILLALRNLITAKDNLINKIANSETMIEVIRSIFNP